MITAGTASPPPVGYPLEIFRGAEVIVKFLCCICNMVLRNPVQRFCGHRYCKTCIETLYSRAAVGDSICPSCAAEDSGEDKIASEEEIRELFPDNAIKREMNKLEVHCPHPGCEWTGVFKEFIEHFEQHPKVGDNCCPLGCGADLTAETSIDEHVKSNIIAHLEPMMNRVTALELQLGLQRGAVEQTSAAASNTTSHPAAAASIAGKLSKLKRHIGELQKDVSSMATRSSAAQNKSGSSAAASSAGAIARDVEPSMLTGDKMIIIEGVITVLNREIEKLTLDVEAMDRQRRLDRELLDYTDKRVKSLERLIAMKDATITELAGKVTALEQTSWDGTLIWRVADVTMKRQEAQSGRTTSIYSSPFYTSRTGYKMCLRVYLNGDGMGRGSHLSAFFVVMRGNYDAMLRWPFRQKVTLMLLNLAQREHIVDAFRPDPTSSSFKRPTSDMNIASGCPLFAPAEIFDDPSRGFVKDDTLFLKVIVDCSDLTAS